MKEPPRAGWVGRKVKEGWGCFIQNNLSPFIPLSLQGEGDTGDGVVVNSNLFIIYTHPPPLRKKEGGWG